MSNRLAHETSPYLQQHADNPVDWYAWGPEALALSRETGRPILLSIGYSACHWCHVMAHESFEDADVAAVMNRLYVNVKVDREERPDLDQIYQSAHHMLTQRSGGWPLTLFLTPDGTPFFAGTYFPKSPRYNLPGFVDLLERVAQAYSQKRGDIEQQNQALREALARSNGEGARRIGPSLAGADRWIGTLARRQFRPWLRRLRRGAEVSPSDRSGLLAPSPYCRRRRPRAKDGADDARPHGGGWHL